VPSAVDPEEALVAAASSCHMLWFLSIAARRGYTVDSYEDAAYGVVEENNDGRQAFSQITLRPEIEFSGSSSPSAPDLSVMHQEAHDACFIANSLCCEVIVAAV
jgi:organic hydroperoxide reductase OsmC/OhrA